MKRRSLLNFGLSLIILGVGALSVSAQSRRYPTDAEVRRVIRELRQEIQNASDDRSNSEIQSRNSFVRAWAQVDSAVAPFLGNWEGNEQGLYIFPSNVRGRVCIIDIGFPGAGEPSDANFSTGSISNNQIRTNTRNLILNQGNYLVLIYANARARVLLVAPKRVEALTRASLNNAPETSRVIQQFNVNGCRASLPGRR